MWLLTMLIADARADVVDRVVAVVDARPLLASEIAIEGEIARLDPSCRLAPPPGDPLAWAIDRAVLRALASKVSLYEPAAADVRTKIEALRDTFVDRDAWAAFLDRRGLDEDRLAELIKRQLVVDRYLSRNVQADPSDAAAWTAAVEVFLAPLRPPTGPVQVRVVQPSDAP